MTAEVSVIIPTHDRADLLSAAIDSVLGQSEPEVGALEVIVVDDASTDDTARVLEAYGDAVVVIRTEKNVERGAARNLGAEAARGEFLAFLDSDDEWAPDKLRRQLPVSREAAATVTGAWLIDRRGRRQGRYMPPADAIRRLGVMNLFLGSPSSLLVRRGVFSAAGGFPTAREIQGSEDWVFLLRLRALGVQLRLVDRYDLRYRIHDGNSTASPEGMIRSKWAAIGALVSDGLVTPEEGRLARLDAAETTAMAYALHRRRRPAVRWGVEALRNARPRDLARSSARWGAAAARRPTRGR